MARGHRPASRAWAVPLAVSRAWPVSRMRAAVRRRVRPTVRVRLTLLFTVGTVLVLVLAGSLFYLLLRANLRDSVDSELRTRADVLTARLDDRFATGGAGTNGAGTGGSGSAGTDGGGGGEQVPGGGPGDGAAQAGGLLAGGGSIAQVLAADGRVLASSADAGPATLLTPGELAAARARPRWFTTGAPLERTHATRLYAVPVHPGAPARPGPTFVAVVGSPTRLADRAEDRIRNVMIVASVPLIALSGLAAWLLSGAALRPVDRMRRETAAMADAEDAPGPAAPTTAPALAVPATHDEIAALARTMNDLLRRLHAARARDRAFVADAGHELRTPLTVLKAELELAARPGRSAAELRTAVASASEETERLIRLAESLLTLARMDGGPLVRVPVALDEILDRAARARIPLAAAREVRVRVDVADRPLTLRADPDLLRQAVDNLLANAVRHAPPGSTVDLGGQRAPDGRDSVVVRVRDRGRGFPPAFLPHAFERFRRADAARGRDDGGTGLGLAIVAAIVTAHGGTARAANHPDGGALLTVVLPTGDPTP